MTRLLHSYQYRECIFSIAALRDGVDNANLTAAHKRRSVSRLSAAESVLLATSLAGDRNSREAARTGWVSQVSLGKR